MMGFDFEDAPVTEYSTMPLCGKCGLHLKCNSPRMPVYGKGGKKILIVSTSPGVVEDLSGVQMRGDVGDRLRSTLEVLGCDLEEDCWKTNAVRCYPPEAVVKKHNVKCCQPNLVNVITELAPEKIILLGREAVDSCIGRFWARGVGTLDRWVGWTIPLKSINTWICPTYHPSYLLRKNQPVLNLWFERHMRSFLELKGRPWKKVFNPQDHVECCMSTDEAAKIIRSEPRDGPIVFDYETNRLKPDAKDSRILCCSICWGPRRTLSYPWGGEAIKATSELFKSRVPKWGASIKFEQRWTKAILGHGVRGWEWDCMQAAHILDNRTGITSVKFQAFVRLGQELWDAKVEPYMESDETGKNRLSECPMMDLLMYCGIDSIMEYQIAKKQRKEMCV